MTAMGLFEGGVEYMDFGTALGSTVLSSPCAGFSAVFLTTVEPSQKRAGSTGNKLADLQGFFHDDA